MKYSIIAALFASGASANRTPIQPTTPGYRLGTAGAPVEIKVFYDMLCPDSFDAQLVWKSLFPLDSPVAGKTYEQLVDMKVTAFVLPYHTHSFQMTQVFPLIHDVCPNADEVAD